MNNIENILNFAKNIRSEAKGIVISDQNTKMLESLLSGDNKKIKKLNEMRHLRFLEAYHLDLDEHQLMLFYLSSGSLKWHRPEQQSKEGFLSGGFAFNGIEDVFLFDSLFWEKSIDIFKKYESESLIDFDELKRLKWIESTTALTEPYYSPQFGCVEFEKNRFPDKFLFYDSGLTYALPFDSFDAYINALLASSAVRCWQYFYIDPAIIIAKNKGLKYITWSLHATSHLDGDLDKLAYNTHAKFDRLDLINEYLERCVRLLPSAFPFLDFSHHKEHYARFSALFDKNRG